MRSRNALTAEEPVDFKFDEEVEILQTPPPPPELDYAAIYGAAIIDAEGSVLVTRRPGRGRNGRLTFSVVAVVSNTDLRLLIWLRHHFAGSIVGPLTPSRSKPGWYPQFRWGVSHRLARPVLERIRPHMLLKATLVDNALDLLDLQLGRAGYQDEATYQAQLACYTRHVAFNMARGDQRSRMLARRKEKV